MSNEVYNPDIIEDYDPVTPNRNNERKPEIGQDDDDRNIHSDSHRGFGESFKLFFGDTRLRLLVGFILGICSVYLLVTMISFLNNCAIDQSVITSQGSIQIAQGDDDVENNGGALGAKLAQYIINDGIGVSAFMIPIWMILMSLSVLKIRRFSFFMTTFSSLLFIAAASLSCGYVSLKLDSIINWGGLFGRETDIFLIRWVGELGTVGIIAFVILFLVILWFNNIAKFISRISESVKKRKRNNSNIQERRNNDVVIPQQTEPSRGFEPVIQESVVSEQEPESPAQSMVHPDIHTFSEQESVENQEVESPENVSVNDTENSESIPSTTVIAPDIERAETINDGNYDPTKELSRYKFPPIDLLQERTTNKHSVDLEEQENNKKRITETLLNYGISIKNIEVCVGPTVTLFEIIPDDGVRISKIKNLENDIALSLAALGIRIIAPIPGKGTIGIEVPNHDPQVVSMRSIIESKKYQQCKYELPMAIGCTITNEVFIADLCKMPHILVAGATGQGKSVGLNAIITSLIYRKHPAELKFVLIDPKMVEFSLYSKLEHHYLAKLPDEEDAIITDPKKVVATLNSLTIEMDNRYSLLKDAKSRNIQEYNAKYVSRRLNPERGHRYMPYIVIIVDEFADLIMMSGKEVETPIARIAQKARAVGIHMIIATQRPSTDVITGMIKANFPGRIAFRVSQMVDSRTILDCSGAQQLIGRGDMLFLQNGELERIQCALIETPEVEAICDHIDHQIGYENAYILPEYIPESDSANGSFGGTLDKDPLFDDAARFVVTSKTASTSSLQRKYSIGYNRAGKIMDQMEAVGIVGPAQGGKPRQVLMDPFQLEQILGK